MIKRLGPDDLRRMWADPGLSYAAKMHFQRLWKRTDLDSLTMGAFIAEVGTGHAAEIQALNRELRLAGYAYLEHTRQDADEDDDDGNPVPVKWRAGYWLSSIPYPGDIQDRRKTSDSQRKIVAAMRDLTERTGLKGCQVRPVADHISPADRASRNEVIACRVQMQRMVTTGQLKRRGTGRDVNYFVVARDRRVRRGSMLDLLTKMQNSKTT